METHRSERERRDNTRAAAWASTNRQTEAQRELRGPSGQPVKKGNLAERSKYQFEADSDDERMEDEIDSNLDALGGAVGRMNMLVSDRYTEGFLCTPLTDFFRVKPWAGKWMHKIRTLTASLERYAHVRIPM